MDFLKDVFGAGALTYEQFTKAVGDKGIKLADLSQGGYVTKQKYDDELKAKGEQIEALNGNIKTRDSDIAKLKKQLEAAGGDADKIKELTANLAELQGKYDTETKAFADKMSKQAYGFAVREFAGTQKFTSEAAKREFIRSLEEKELQLDNGKIMGVSDFLTQYKADNADSFAPDDPKPPTPKFIDKTPGAQTNPGTTDPFLAGFENN